MGFLKKLLPFALAGASLQGLAVGVDFPQDDINSGKALQQLGQTAMENALARLEGSSSTCTKENVRRRKEWRNIPGEERKAYVKAVECLMELPKVYENVTGPKSMFDSFGVLHYKMTPYVHNSAYFLLFHRLYVWTFEEKLRTMCGYTGAFPYWEWGLDAGSVEKSPLFDGSETSLGSNGAKINTTNPGFFPGGSGGGCVTNGPFVNYTVNFGPNTAKDPLAYNPRCLKRDLNTQICAQWASLQNTTETILESPDIALFQANLQGDFRWPEARKWGFAVHGGGHFAIAGDPGGDFYFSPLEPGFYQHHGQIDRMYFIWQNLDWENRQTMAGTITMMNMPESRNGTLDDVLDISPVGGSFKYGELLDTVGASPFCFVYE
ncbi:putative tyrosinase central domain-containing protein [Daldinia childiae]|uniref:putative tyrosinase central domain-containing protein n=1 Tax=Daldinia childiae TaxID=326645 RepID=UPI001444CA64|nr:putative tyrosinase central domain-containing protein [Daldinia childiae]KAF3057392.1 putative tyrosinase central domain-containing protein [Daldinia childiae]